jgi:sensor histidine kinase YesM
VNKSISTPTFGLSILSFIAIFVGVMISSTTKWIDHPKSIRLFIVVLVCMLISLVLALSMNYKIFTHIYTLIKSLLEMTVVYIAPFGIIAIAIMNFVFSKMNHDKILNRIPTDT